MKHITPAFGNTLFSVALLLYVMRYLFCFQVVVCTLVCGGLQGCFFFELACMLAKNKMCMQMGGD